MKLSQFDYTLPSEHIACFPRAQRKAAKLLVSYPKQPLQHDQFENLFSHFTPNDLLVFNDSKVIKARLLAKKESGGQIELFITQLINEHEALAIFKASHPPKSGSNLWLEAESSTRLTVLAHEGGTLRLQFPPAMPVLQLLEQFGQVPIPPYFKRRPLACDLERYQTVYACEPGSVAAPTAGLHFDEAMLTQMQARQIPHAYVTLHVGLGTFQPIQCDDVTEHVMHAEWTTIPAATVAAIAACRKRGGRIIAIGTTALRALESAAAASTGGALMPYTGNTQLFVYPGYRFRVVDGLLTNFHLPKSSLVILVASFVGERCWRAMYQAALDNGYQFLSYGDTSLLFR